METAGMIVGPPRSLKEFVNEVSKEMGVPVAPDWAGAADASGAPSASSASGASTAPVAPDTVSQMQDAAHQARKQGYLCVCIACLPESMRLVRRFRL